MNKIKQATILLLLMVFHLSCLASPAVENSAVDIKNLFCGYDLGKEIKKSIVSQKTIQNGNNYSINIKIKYRHNKKETTALLILSCPVSIDSIQPIAFQEPRDMVALEDAGGRYFRHIAWERKIEGINWQGLIAYSDYIFGDGEKSLTYDYYICPRKSYCFEFKIESSLKLSLHERENILQSLKKMEYKIN